MCWHLIFPFHMTNSHAFFKLDEDLLKIWTKLHEQIFFGIAVVLPWNEVTAETLKPLNPYR